MRLRDGSPVTLRAVTPSDEPGLRCFLAGLCPEAQRLRFFTGAANMGFAAHLAASTGADRYGLIAFDVAGIIVGHALYVRLDQTGAEVGVEVADHLHGRGLGTMLIQELAATAENHGITRFTAQVLPENRAMLDVFRDGFDAHIRECHGLDSVEFGTACVSSMPWTGQRRVRQRLRPTDPRPPMRPHDVRNCMRDQPTR
jgi:GNAT superfamily N-acetyltransferase